MNENIDLTKILKDCPEGWKFYSSIYGEVEFVEIKPISPCDYPIRFKIQNDEFCVSSAGEHIKGMGECTFFPSCEQRDWCKFSAPWYKKEKFDPKTLQPFDKVLVRDNNSERWRVQLFSNIIEYDVDYLYFCINSTYRYCIPYNDDTKHLVGASNEAPEYYRYWED